MRMHTLKTMATSLLSVLALSACSVFGSVSVNVAPYDVLEKDDAIEVRQYQPMTLVRTAMSEGMESASDPFRLLFGYISGDNDKNLDIKMTAPVLLDQNAGTTEAMSFVLPVDVSMGTAPRPENDAVELSELTNYKVAVITFTGFLNQQSISEQRKVLEKWIADNGYRMTGEAKAAGYNPPFTLPFLRRNEVLIPVE